MFKHITSIAHRTSSDPYEWYKSWILPAASALPAVNPNFETWYKSWNIPAAPAEPPAAIDPAWYQSWIIAPVSPPVIPPVSPPVTPPVSPPVTPPVSPPVTPPVPPPVTPPVSPPVTPPVPPPVTPPPVKPSGKPINDSKPPSPQTTDDIKPDEISKLIEYISSDYYEGRRTATKKGNEFAGWLADAFEKRGLKGGGTNGSFFQEVTNFGDNRLDNGVPATETHSPNVIGILEGSDPKLKNEYIIYSAHYDHLGKDPNTRLDGIWNGAVDNGTGIAMMLEIAEKFRKNPPKRSVIFVGFTGEEEGLYGSQDFAEKLYSGQLAVQREESLVPIYSYQVRGGLNIDEDIPHVKGKDMPVAGYGIADDTSGVMALLAKHVNAQGRHILPDPKPQEQYYERSDHFSLVELLGTPMIFPLNTGADLDEYEGQSGKPRRYHRPSDQWDPKWLREGKMDGLAEDSEAYYNFGQDLANSSEPAPVWDANSPYKQIRDDDLARRPIS